jgi:subtilisin family serine protease
MQSSGRYIEKAPERVVPFPSQAGVQPRLEGSSHKELPQRSGQKDRSEAIRAKALSLVDLDRSDLASFALPMSHEVLHTHENLLSGNLSDFVDRYGVARRFNPEFVLLKFAGAAGPSALHVERGTEVAAAEKLSKRSDVLFAELDVVCERQFIANDHQLSSQWHHGKLHSTEAWDVTLGSGDVKIGIVDWPFQMDHPDLAGNKVDGWDEVTDQTITKSAGDFHSTIGAGLAAAVVNNSIGVAGLANVRVLPINIDAFISDMDSAIRWSADHGVRVVNISYDGCDSSTLNDAGTYLQQKVGGLLVMAGINIVPSTGKAGLLAYRNHPAILAVSMTDESDTQRSCWGAHIDFSAPGWDIFSTTTGSTYDVDSGTSYSAPLVAGAIAFIMSINPSLGPSEIIEILKRTATDLGTPGWDQYYGWGQINLGKAAREAFATLPVSRIAVHRSDQGFEISTEFVTNATYRLFHSLSLQPPDWMEILNPARETNDLRIFLLDTNWALARQYYELRVRLN